MTHTVWQLAKEVIVDLFFFLSAFLGFIELIVVYYTRNDLLLLNVKDVLCLLKHLSDLLPMLKCTLVLSLAFIFTLLPCIELLSELLVSLLDQLHIECT